MESEGCNRNSRGGRQKFFLFCFLFWAMQNSKVKTEFKSVKETTMSKLGAPGNSCTENRSIESVQSTGAKSPEGISFRKLHKNSSSAT